MSLSGHNNPAIRPLSSRHVRHAIEASTYYHHLFFPCLEMQAVWRKKWAHHRWVEWNIMPPHCFYDWSWHESLPFIFAFRPGFFSCTPEKNQGHQNSRNRKLKKITQNSRKNLHFPAFLDQNLKYTFWKIAQLIAKSNSQGRKVTHFFISANK